MTQKLAPELNFVQQENRQTKNHSNTSSASSSESTTGKSCRDWLVLSEPYAPTAPLPFLCLASMGLMIPEGTAVTLGAVCSPRENSKGFSCSCHSTNTQPGILPLWLWPLLLPHSLSSGDKPVNSSTPKQTQSRALVTPAPAAF